VTCVDGARITNKNTTTATSADGVDHCLKRQDFSRGANVRVQRDAVVKQSRWQTVPLTDTFAVRLMSVLQAGAYIRTILTSNDNNLVVVYLCHSQVDWFMRLLLGNVDGCSSDRTVYLSDLSVRRCSKWSCVRQWSECPSLLQVVVCTSVIWVSAAAPSGRVYVSDLSVRRCSKWSWLALVMFFVYILTTSIMLINLLIAIFRFDQTYFPINCTLPK